MLRRPPSATRTDPIVPCTMLFRSVAWRALCVFMVLGFVFLLAPIAVIVVGAFDASDYMAFPPRQLSLRWFHAFFQNAEFMSALKVSTRSEEHTSEFQSLMRI